MFHSLVFSKGFHDEHFPLFFLSYSKSLDQPCSSRVVRCVEPVCLQDERRDPPDQHVHVFSVTSLTAPRFCTFLTSSRVFRACLLFFLFHRVAHHQAHPIINTHRSLGFDGWSRRNISSLLYMVARRTICTIQVKMITGANG